MILIFLIIIIILVIFVYYKKYLIRENFESNLLENTRIKLENMLDKKKLEKEKLKKKNSENVDYSKKIIRNNRILITGATSGTGYVIAKMLNTYQPTLIICGKKSEKVEKIIESFKKTNKKVYGIAQDLSKSDGVLELYKKVLKIVSGVDILINNAHTNKGSKFLLTKKPKDYIEEINVNLNSSIILSQKIGHHMKKRKIKGRIINISSQNSKDIETGLSNGSTIIAHNSIEKYSKLLADELNSYNIASTIIRIDIPIDSGQTTVMNKKVSTEKYRQYFGDLLGKKPHVLKPVFLYAINAPINELNGKIISVDSFLNDENLSKIIPSYQFKVKKELYDNIFYIKNKNKNNVYLVKQNPFKMSPNTEKLINKNIVSNINKVTHHDSVLPNVIAKNNNISPKNICIFANEYDALKKICDIFVPKYQDVITSDPVWSYLQLLTIENKINLQFYIYKKEGKKLTINYSSIKNKINPKTKMIYLSSPNLISGQSIEIELFESFLDTIPSNIMILLDQRYYEFSNKKKNKLLNGINYINKPNVLVLRSFNNYYSIETLELSYIITNKKLAEFINSSIVINPINTMNEKLALSVYKDNYYDKIKDLINRENKKFIRIFNENNIKYFNSEVNFILVEFDRDIIEKELEEKNIILYDSDDSYNNYHTLPINIPKINDIVIDTLLYNL